MNDQLSEYEKILSGRITSKISEKLSGDKGTDWLKRTLEIYLLDSRSSNFQGYYFSILNDSKNFLNDNNFFVKFKQQYGLQGMTSEYLYSLETSKPHILSLIKDKKLAELYSNYFSRASLRRGNSYKEINLGSFFTKLVHNFLPDDYCALDNPIKNALGLKNEGFFVSFIVISEAYKAFSRENQERMGELKKELFKLDQKNLFKKDKLTDIKLIDLIFWSDANRPL